VKVSAVPVAYHFHAALGILEEVGKADGTADETKKGDTLCFA
jgi:hypothetical protein